MRRAPVHGYLALASTRHTMSELSEMPGLGESTGAEQPIYNPRNSKADFGI